MSEVSVNGVDLGAAVGVVAAGMDEGLGAAILDKGRVK